MNAGASPGVHAAAALAADLVENGTKVGLGTGRAASAFIARLAERAAAGLSVACVATSEASAQQAHAAGLPLIALTEDLLLDITVDGADEVAPNLDLLKGRGGAFVRERIVAAASRRQVILVGPEKLMGALGETGPIPVEIIPMALGFGLRRIKEVGGRPRPRQAGADAGPVLSDNGNVIVDVRPPAPFADPAAARAFDAALRSIPGLVDTGLFFGTAEHVLIGHPDGRVDTRRREG